MISLRSKPWSLKRTLKLGSQMSFYEHVFIMRQDLSNTQAETLIEEFSNVLSENGGSVVEHEYWGVKTMAYKLIKIEKVTTLF